MDLEALLAQAQSKMQASAVTIDMFVDAIEDHSKSIDDSMKVLNEATQEAQEAFDASHQILGDLNDSVGQLGETVASRLDQFEQKLSEFRDKAQSIQSELATAFDQYTQVVSSTHDSFVDTSTDLLGKLTEYDATASAFEGELNEAEPQLHDLKEQVSTTVATAIETASNDLENCASAIGSFKDLCISKADEAAQQLQSMTEAAEKQGEELLQELQNSSSDKLSALDILFTTDIVSSITDAAGIFTDAAEALQSLGGSEIEKYTLNIDDVLEYSDKLTDIYEEIKPIIDLLD